MNKTANYNLNQWEKSDRVLMEDFNSDNAKIDAALGKKTELVFGTYEGDDAETRTISLGFHAKAVFVCTADGKTYNNGAHLGGLALDGIPAKGTSLATGKVDLITITENGFTVREGAVQSGSGSYITANKSNTVYHFIALA